MKIKFYKNRDFNFLELTHKLNLIYIFPVSYIEMDIFIEMKKNPAWENIFLILFLILCWVECMMCDEMKMRSDSLSSFQRYKMWQVGRGLGIISDNVRLTEQAKYGRENCCLLLADMIPGSITDREELSYKIKKQEWLRKSEQ